MARTTPAGESWYAWLEPRMAAKGWDRQSQLISALADAGFPIARQTVSKWFKKENAADPNVAVIVADVLGAPRSSALRAIGLDVVADGMEKDSPQRQADAYDDDVQVQRIMADESRSYDRRIAMVRKYRERSARIVDYMLEDAGDDGEVGTG